jgi:predicted nucleic acid binding AN1-type Zn finger protein
MIQFKNKKLEKFSIASILNKFHACLLLGSLKSKNLLHKNLVEMVSSGIENLP